MRRFRTLAGIAGALALGACSGASVNTVWDPLRDFSTLRAYDWLAKGPESGPDLPYEQLDGWIRAAVEQELAAKGFRKGEGSVGFRVIYYIGTEEVATVDRGYYGVGWGGHWGYGWYGPGGVNASLYDDGSITIDIVSPDEHFGLLWRGVVKSRFDPALGTDRMQRDVREAVADILKNFPPSE